MLFQKELIKLNNVNLKDTAEKLIDTFLEAGKIAKKKTNADKVIKIKIQLL